MMLAGGILKRRGCPMTPAAIDETHAPQAESWLSDANGHPDFPVQNLPLGIFSEVGGTARGGVAIGDHIIDLAAIVSRSEEHTSELQSLMRHSYAVFCLKKKKTNTHKKRQ